MPQDPLEGVYEHVVTRELRHRIDTAQARNLQVHSAPLRPSGDITLLVREIATRLRRVLSEIADREGEGGAEAQRLLCNQILGVLAPGELPEGTEIHENPEVLRAITVTPEEPRRPLMGLARTLLLDGRNTPSLGSELVAEFETAQAVSAVVSFVKTSGWRRIRDHVERFVNRGRRFRLLTTTYMGASDEQALLSIARMPGVDVRISFDTRRTRLHAKAWLFQRPDGLSTAYVGSANLSSSALSDGLEWTLKISEAANPDVVEAFRASFETLWEDGEFEAFQPDDSEHRARLTEALAEARRSAPESSPSASGGGEGEPPVFFDLRPFPFQEEILERLALERIQGRNRNLLVSATGTGKTVIAAFDYRRICKERGARPRLLFVAHRDEILQQARRTFREVLRDTSFGERLGGGAQPREWDFVFANIQSLPSSASFRRLPADHWDYVVVDEIHRGAAASYREFLETIAPKVLLGMTATPERTDGQDILRWFGGAPAAEVRLWDALDRRLLAPFDYFGIHDGVDLSRVEWSRGGYDLSALDRLYTGNDARARLVLRQFQERYGDLSRARALGFCVSVQHAEFMARSFSEQGLPSAAVHGGTLEAERTDAPRRLASREVNVLFTCDLYNEGVDIPEVDSVLLLRPTESALLFQQQLGRGLRLHPGKSSVLILDFIGQCRREFRFSERLRVLTRLSTGHLRREVEDGFPYLPPGCSMELDRVSREIVLQNLRETLGKGRRALLRDLEALRHRVPGEMPTLRAFLASSGRELADVYAGAGGGWTALLSAAGLIGDVSGDEIARSPALDGLLHEDDTELLSFWGSTISGAGGGGEASPLGQRRLAMLERRIRPAQATRCTSAGEFLGQLSSLPYFRAELAEVITLLGERSVPVRTPPVLLPEGWAMVPHRSYTRDEVLHATGASSWQRERPSREGVLYLEEEGADIFFVTLDKSDDAFTPSTRYEDYALSDRLFHWQSQGGTSADSPTGRRYQGLDRPDSRFFLFVRERRKDAGRTLPFVFLGPVSYLSHEGSRPMSITWKLEIPIPARFVDTFVRYRSA